MSHMKTATVRDLRNNFARVSRWLRAGEEVTITRRGEVMGKLVPARENRPTRKRPLFDVEEHRQWRKEIYGDKVLQGNSVLLMREGSKW
jgi:antitoxin (DNA-binding transcriptional repressor) of toxin-antitoxin stability system